MSSSALPSLAAFLSAPARPNGTLLYHELQGFLFAVACCPDLITPSDWLPEVFYGLSAGYRSRAEAQHIVGELTRVYNEVNASVLTGSPTLPPDCTVHGDVLANFDAGAPLCQWARGFIAGDEWLAEAWDVEAPDDEDEEVGEEIDGAALVLSFFGARETAELLVREGEFGDDTLDVVAARMLALIPEAMASYAHIGRHVLAPAYAPVEQRRVTKVGRNDPCPCGSGRKFKQCCGKA